MSIDCTSDSFTLQGVLSGIVSEHISVGLRVNLVRHHVRPEMTYKKFNVEDVVKDDASKATNAKSVGQPSLPEMIRIGNSFV